MIDKPLHPYASAELQTESRKWWNTNPMSYDWHGTNPAQEGTREFFEEIDRRFFGASPLFKGTKPFASLIPFDDLNGKRVLEIGCGQGSHSQLLTTAGCTLTSIDLTARAVDLTKRRLAINGLTADVREMDAERMEFQANEFDFVWSWGVIHHSANTDQIVREVTRVLKPGGEFRFMVYNRHAFDTYMKVVRGLVTTKPLRGMSVDDILSFYTDGYVARFYSRDTVTKLVEENGLRIRETSVLGQTSELLPLSGKGTMGRIKYSLLAHFPERLSATVLRAAGSFLFAIAYKPR
jgi:2-polyprenyl-3-methyl-5-hydroxy-6-metoxy-1,4-benzoquinol methylase